MIFAEWPKMVYIGGKGYKCNNAEEEQALTGVKPMLAPVPSCVEQKIEDAKLITEELPDEVSPVQRQITSADINRAYPQVVKEAVKHHIEHEKKKPGRPKGSKGKKR